MSLFTRPPGLRSIIARLTPCAVLLCSLPAVGQSPPKQQDEDHGRPIAQMAKELGVTPDRLREALRKIHHAGPGAKPTQAQRQADRKMLSESMGVLPERLDWVMDKYRPAGPGANGPRRNGGGDPQRQSRPGGQLPGQEAQDRRSPRRAAGAEDEDHGRPVALVAKELGVTPEQFRAAFRKVHPAGVGQQPTEAQRQANRKVLSESLGVSPERLDAVMDKYRPGGRGNNGPKRQ